MVNYAVNYLFYMAENFWQYITYFYTPEYFYPQPYGNLSRDGEIQCYEGAHHELRGKEGRPPSFSRDDLRFSIT